MAFTSAGSPDSRPSSRPVYRRIARSRKRRLASEDGLRPPAKSVPTEGHRSGAKPRTAIVFNACSASTTRCSLGVLVSTGVPARTRPRNMTVKLSSSTGPAKSFRGRDEARTAAAPRAFFRRLSAFVFEIEICARYEELQDDLFGRQRRRRNFRDDRFEEERDLGAIQTRACRAASALVSCRAWPRPWKSSLRER